MAAVGLMRCYAGSGIKFVVCSIHGVRLQIEYMRVCQSANLCHAPVARYTLVRPVAFGITATLLILSRNVAGGCSGNAPQVARLSQIVSMAVHCKGPLQVTIDSYNRQCVTTKPPNRPWFVLASRVEASV